MSPSVILRLEGAAIALLSLAFVWSSGPSVLFAVVALAAPDLSIAAYLIGRRAGAIAYNLAHSTIGPLALGAVGMFTGERTLVELGLLWLAHVGIDRALGFGLKGTSFRDTHLGPLD